MSFVHLHVYSSYSLLSSTITINKLVKTAQENEFSAIALTDYNVMYGIIPFYKACVANNVKPIIGLTIDTFIVKNDEQTVFPLILLAKNKTGYRNLMKISSKIKTAQSAYFPLEKLGEFSDGLFCLTTGKTGVIERSLLQANFNKAEQIANKIANLFSANSFYLGIQNDLTAESAQLGRLLAQLSEQTQIPLVALNSTVNLQAKDTFVYHCLQAIANGEKFTRGQLLQYLEGDTFPTVPETEQSGRTEVGIDLQITNGEQQYLKSAAEMQALFTGYNEAIENTVKIAEQCNVTIEFNKQLLPKYPVEDGKSASEFLQQLCEIGLQARYSEITNVHRERLLYELDVIDSMGFSDYFLIVWDFMKYARENNIMTGPGRGSAAGSLVAYVLYITNVDPLKYNLLFERFLNPVRVSLPDIDIDFPDNRRNEVINYVAEKYGKLHVAQIITFGTFGAKAALRDVGRTFGLQRTELDKLSSFVPSSPGMTLRKAYETVPSFKKYVNESDYNKLLFKTSLKIEGLPRHTSTHAAGVIISDIPLVDLVPLQTGHDDIYLTQFSMDYLEQLGLLKMDFLGLRNLTLLETIVTGINESRDPTFNLETIPLNDRKTFQLLSKGDTAGIFQLESTGMQQVLTRLKPSTFEDIVAVNALYRPGPMDSIPVYINRKHRREQTIYPHHDLVPILESTYGVIVYQEQIMQIAATMANFTLAEADLLRKAVSKKQENILREEREHFVKGALKKGYDIKVAEQTYDLIVKFAHYGFNRSHAVAYSMIAYQLAYLKANYPLQFMAALLTSALGNDRKISEYIQQLKVLGYQVLPPSINRSRYSFFIENNQLRYSLAAIKGVGQVALREIFAARREKPFTDLFDFCVRVPVKAVNRKTIEALIFAGCFDEFNKDRATLLATLDIALNHAQLVQPNNGKQSFFDDGLSLITPKYNVVEPIPIEEKLRYEKEYLGIYLSDHPISYYNEYLEKIDVKLLSEYKPFTKNVLIAAFIAEVKQIRTKKGEAMAFITISDQSMEIEGVVFPKVYRTIAPMLKEGTHVLLQGNLEQRNEKTQLIVNSCEYLSTIVSEMDQTLYIKVTEATSKGKQLQQLHSLIKKNRGYCPIVIHYEDENRTTQLINEYWIRPTQKLIVELTTIFGIENIVLRK